MRGSGPSTTVSRQSGRPRLTRSSPLSATWRSARRSCPWGCRPSSSACPSRSRRSVRGTGRGNAGREIRATSS
nr:MAG TPA: hypothetical protein [Caudoviricetes sp.]